MWMGFGGEGGDERRRWLGGRGGWRGCRGEMPFWSEEGCCVDRGGVLKDGRSVELAWSLCGGYS